MNPPPVSADERRERHWRLAFRLLCIAAMALMALLSFDYGINGDEVAQQDLGERYYAYYRSGFTDRSALHVPTIYLYGGLFELACVVAQKLSPLFLYDTRHLLNAIVGCLGMIYAARSAGLLMGARAACIALVLLVASPYYFGHCMNDSKDIPFATGYAASVYYMLQMAPPFPFASRSLMTKIGLAIAATIAVRFGGLLSICYFWLLAGVHAIRARRFAPRDLAVLGAIVGIVSLAAFLAGTSFCPWAVQKPFIRPFQALANLGHQPGVPVLFEGQWYKPATLPIRYAPKMLALTLPITVLVVGLSSVLLLGVLRGEARLRLAFLYFAALFPVGYVMATHGVVYSGIRHLLFVCLPLASVAAVGCEVILRWASEGARLRYGALAALVLGLADPVRFHFANHPNQDVYFNSLVGGLPGAFLRYEIDAWGQSSVKLAVEWALEHGGIPPDRSIRITGGRWPMWVMMTVYAEQYPRLIWVGKRNPPNADFHFQLLQYDPATQRNALATGNILHAISADGVPLCLIKAGRGWKAATGHVAE